MTKIRKPKFDKPQVTAEDAMQDWRESVIKAQPLVNADYVRTVCQAVIQRAHTLAMQNGLNFPEVAAFLLMASRDWFLGGFPVAKVVDRLPADLYALGMLKIEHDKSAVDVFVKRTKRPN